MNARWLPVVLACGCIKSGAMAPARSPNPFARAELYVNPDYARKVSDPRVGSSPTAIWIDAIARVPDVARHLDAARGKLVVFVIYDLPNRDCGASASAGELAAEDEGRYRSEYIDRIAALFANHGSQPIAAIVEPDSLANIATNLGVPRCGASSELYRRSVAYAVSALSMPHVSLYLDAGHGGWLGWPANRTKIAEIYRDVLARAGGAHKIRGFATNVSNYNALSGEDGKRLDPKNPCPDELTYVKKLTETLAGVGITDKGFVIDTGRNGRAVRSKWANWCNIAGAGLGERPRASPAAGVDAYLWIKPPGESDGTSDERSPRFDAMCRSPDSVVPAPEAGAWFPEHFAELVRNAGPPL